MTINIYILEFNLLFFNFYNLILNLYICEVVNYYIIIILIIYLINKFIFFHNCLNKMQEIRRCSLERLKLFFNCWIIYYLRKCTSPGKFLCKPKDIDCPIRLSLLVNSTHI